MCCFTSTKQIFYSSVHNKAGLKRCLLNMRLIKRLSGIILREKYISLFNTVDYAPLSFYSKSYGYRCVQNRIDVVVLFLCEAIIDDDQTPSSIDSKFISSGFCYHLVGKMWQFLVSIFLGIFPIRPKQVARLISPNIWPNVILPQVLLTKDTTPQMKPHSGSLK